MATKSKSSSSSLASRLIQSAGKNSMATIMNSSNFGDKKVICQTNVPALNILMGGDLDGGIVCGITQIVAPSKSFKTNLLVEIIATYLEKVEDSIAVILDSEFSVMAVFENRCPELMDRIIHVPIVDIEVMKQQTVKMIEDVQLGEKVIFGIDSLGQIASKKEVDNAMQDNEAADMTRAKAMNSFFRIITPMLNLRNCPMYCINGFYEDTTNKYADPIIRGGQQSQLSSDAVWFGSRAQDKDVVTKELLGWTFNYKTMKSRFVIEKSVIPLHVTYKGGIDTLSGVPDWAIESGYLLVPTQGFYQFNPTLLPGSSDKKYRMKELIANPILFDPILSNPGFRDFIRNKYSLAAQMVGTAGSV